MFYLVWNFVQSRVPVSIQSIISFSLDKHIYRGHPFLLLRLTSLATAVFFWYNVLFSSSSLNFCNLMSTHRRWCFINLKQIKWHIPSFKAIELVKRVSVYVWCAVYAVRSFSIGCRISFSLSFHPSLHPVHILLCFVSAFSYAHCSLYARIHVRARLCVSVYLYVCVCLRLFLYIANNN